LAIFRYAIECIRLDVGHVVRVLFKFTSRQMRSIDNSIERVMRCLKKIMTLGSHYDKYHIVLEWYQIQMRSIILYMNDTRYKIEHLSDEF